MSRPHPFSNSCMISGILRFECIVECGTRLVNRFAGFCKLVARTLEQIVSAKYFGSALFFFVVCVRLLSLSSCRCSLFIALISRCCCCCAPYMRVRVCVYCNVLCAYVQMYALQRENRIQDSRIFVSLKIAANEWIHMIWAMNICHTLVAHSDRPMIKSYTFLKLEQISCCTCRAEKCISKTDFVMELCQNLDFAPSSAERRSREKKGTTIILIHRENNKQILDEHRFSDSRKILPFLLLFFFFYIHFCALIHSSVRLSVRWLFIRCGCMNVSHFACVRACLCNKISKASRIFIFRMLC